MLKKVHSVAVFSVVLSLVLTGTTGAALIGHWPLDGNPTDRSGNGYNGTVEGGVTFEEGVLGLAADYNGSNATVNCSDVPVGGTGAVTVAFWVKPRNIGQDWAGYVSKWTLNNSQRTFWIGQHATEGWLRFGIYPSGPTAETSIDSGQVILANEQWTHIACTYDGNVQKIYADGVEIVASPDRNADIVDRGGALRFGVVSTANWYNGLIDDVQIYDEALPEAKIQTLMKGISQGQAEGPIPTNEATDVLRDVVLSWTSGEFANTHDVYLGTRFDDVNDADRDNSPDTHVGLDLDVSTFDPGRLDLGQTYYWRVDEVNAPPDGTVFKGRVWSFEVEPVSYAVSGDTIHVTASSMEPPQDPNNTINGSGLNDADEHTSILETMWLSAAGDAEPWIQFEFGQLKKLDKVHVWNHNTQTEALLGFGFKEALIETSVDGENWTALKTVELAQASGLGDYTGTEVSLDGVVAQTLRISPQSNHSLLDLKQMGLSEVRFFFIPVQARMPNPTDGETTDHAEVVLQWRAGREASQHEVLLSSDLNAVADGSAIVGTVPGNAFAPDPLNYNTPYYWQINEVNEAETPARYEGEIWEFDTPAYATIDDFEKYADQESLYIWAFWADGFEDSTNGAVVGNGNIGERTVVHEGSQSMPLYYDNIGTPLAEATLQIDGQDWTASELKSLSLFFRGMAGNTGQLYVKINETRIDYNGEAGDIARSVWQPWIIDLVTVAASVQDVTTLTIGIEGAGATGTLYIDDIRLYPLSPEYVTPVAPDNAHRVAYYALDGDATDGSGNGANGTENGAPLYVTGREGQGIRLNGIDDFVDLGIPAHWPSGAAPRTLCAWAQTFSVGPGWRIIAGYGSPAVTQATALVMNGDTLYASGYGSDISLGSFWDTEEWHQVGLTYDGSTVRLYADGLQAVTGERAWDTTINVARIGRQVNEASEFWDGIVDEVHLYDQALSPAEMAWLAGKTEPMVKPF